MDKQTWIEVIAGGCLIAAGYMAFVFSGFIFIK